MVPHPASVASDNGDSTWWKSIQPRDFVATPDQFFAVVAAGSENGRILTSLRYARYEGQWHKLGTVAANDYLQRHLPDYIYSSPRCAAIVHGVPIEAVRQVFKPRTRLAQLLRGTPDSGLAERLIRLCKIFEQTGLPIAKMGITGSILIDRHTLDSDIDLVCYDRTVFHQVRQSIEALCEHQVLQTFDQAEWNQHYARRGCALTLADFVWHERRKWNKAIFENTKFDVTLVTPSTDPPDLQVEKAGVVELTAQISDDWYAFDYPARYPIAGTSCQEILSFTQTYAGQGRIGEWIKARGILEHTDRLGTRLVIGANREAGDHFLRVLL